MPVTIDTTGLDRKMRRLAETLEPRTLKVILKKAARRLLRDMRIRVESKGLGTSGKKMPKYSKAYKKVREKSGRTTDKRTLSFRGTMLGTRGIFPSSGARVLIGWKPGLQAEKALSHELRRAWAQPTKGENKSMIRFLNREIKAAANRS